MDAGQYKIAFWEQPIAAENPVIAYSQTKIAIQHTLARKRRSSEIFNLLSKSGVHCEDEKFICRGHHSSTGLWFLASRFSTAQVRQQGR
jgi:hypothetical protein